MDVLSTYRHSTNPHTMHIFKSGLQGEAGIPLPVALSITLTISRQGRFEFDNLRTTTTTSFTTLMMGKRWWGGALSGRGYRSTSRIDTNLIDDMSTTTVARLNSVELIAAHNTNQIRRGWQTTRQIDAT